MATKAKFEKEWKSKSPSERREKLDELATNYSGLSEDDVRLHDVLATQVAEDEDAEGKEDASN